MDDRFLDLADTATLLRIDTALTGRGWTRSPGAVALLRSIADAAREQPTLRGRRIGELLAAGVDARAPHAVRRHPVRAPRPSTGRPDQAIAAAAASSSVVATS